MLIVAAALGTLVASSSATARPLIVVDQAILVMRHGIRAPLAGEVPDGTRTGQPWPRWSVAESRITDHGKAALMRVAEEDRRRFAAQGLIGTTRCPAAGSVTIHTNTSDRTIVSGMAYAQGLAHGCSLAVHHLPLDRVDPIFEPLRAGTTSFDAQAAIASINRNIGGMQALAAGHASDLALLDGVLACSPRGSGCAPEQEAQVTASRDGKGIDLAGPIRTTSGIAQVLLLQYVEGLPLQSVGWGRVDAAKLRKLGALHAALFDVFTRPPYMAAHQASSLGRDVLDTLAAPDGPQLRVLMGHDTNVTALAAVLRVDLTAPGYATNDVAPGGAILIERGHDPSGTRYVRMFYRTQSPRALRTGARTVDRTPLPVPSCTQGRNGWCSLAKFTELLSANLGPSASASVRPASARSAPR
ncbi:4-phytase/acid phosphatase [Sphingomonas xinjiangensis]|uniref:4-phytase/acid phosphatase n=1 Tax=Sphingomonas xinjiangensis TaxID=643568 RepID=A0A840YR18_9SPHN|nr:histidine-type phosphatase [Sphingomonas xinjiangensis]MBB5711811.1 4-phytase/acid phosphatase [Sphingomonas xinjiangensis]